MRGAQAPGHSLGQRRHGLRFRGRAESAVAAKDLVATQAGKRHFQARLPRRPGNKIGVDAIHAGLVESAHRLAQPRQHIVAAQGQFLVIRSESLRGAAGHFRLAELLLRKDHRYGVQRRFLLGRQGDEGSGIDAAAQEDSHGHIRNQMGLQPLLPGATAGTPLPSLVPASWC